MVEHGLNRVFHALADPTRRSMLGRLRAREHTVSELAQPFHMSLAAASKHVRVLEDAGLLKRTIKGRTHMCRLEAAPLSNADEWLSAYQQFWSDSLDRLKTFLEKEKP